MIRIFDFRSLFFLQLSKNHQNHQKSSKFIEFHWIPLKSIYPGLKTCWLSRKPVEFWVMVALATLEAPDDHQTFPTCLAHEYCRFWEYKVFLMSLSWFLSIFHSGGEGIQLGSEGSIQAWKPVDFPRKPVEFWVMVALATLEAPDDHQTFPTCLAHEYCRFWE